jgi:CheY-like chemotaxis protein
VQGHNGFVEVFSQVNQGTTFKVFLPASDVVGESDTSRFEAPPAGNGEVILVVDYQLAISEIMRGTLESYNYRVLAAGNEAEALSMFLQSKDRIRAVVIDLALAVLDNQTLIQGLRQASPEVKIIGIVAADARSDNKPSEDFQVQAILRKPYTIKELLTTLHNLLTGKSSRH